MNRDTDRSQTAKPILPKELESMKRPIIPDFIIETFNRLIFQNWDGREAKILVGELTIAGAPAGMRLEPYWNYVEDVYREVGWEVKLHRPSISESNPPFYIFRKKNS